MPNLHKPGGQHRAGRWPLGSGCSLSPRSRYKVWGRSPGSEDSTTGKVAGSWACEAGLQNSREFFQRT